jgi:hypothetical protein
MNRSAVSTADLVIRGRSRECEYRLRCPSVALAAEQGVDSETADGAILAKLAMCICTCKIPMNMQNTGMAKPRSITVTKVGLGSTRDLRAEMLGLAGRAAESPDAQAVLRIVDPSMSVERAHEEWTRLLSVFNPGIRRRLKLDIKYTDPAQTTRSDSPRLLANLIPLPRPNYRYEVLRMLLRASLERGDAETVQGLIAKIGVSRTPIRMALEALQSAGIIKSPRRLEIDAQELSLETLSRIGAMPLTLRFRFERGAKLRHPTELFRRAQKLWRSETEEWSLLTLSGVPVAQKDVPPVNLLGLPRLDLVAQLGSKAETLDSGLIRMLDQGLELETNVLAPAPVVVTIVRAEKIYRRSIPMLGPNCAYPHDVLIALLDLGLRGQAIQYAHGLLHHKVKNVRA